MSTTILSNTYQKLSITIEGYAYPFFRDDWDANWLQVSIVFNDYENGMSYEASEPCLLTMELLELKNWIISSYQSDEVNNINFFEPCLAFSLNKDLLSISLGYNFSPLEDKEKKFIFDITLDSNKVNEIVDYLDDNISKFPKKYNPI